MAMIRNIINTVLADHTFPQKGNYLKYLLSNRAEVLSYDPVTISIVATSRCTLSCDMCPTHSSRVPSDYKHAQQDIKDMDLASFREIIDRFRNATTVHIIGSGEPLLNKDFFVMVDYAASRKMVVKTFSNGTTVLDNIDNILNSRLDGITISINGHDAEEFSRMTGMDGNVYSSIYEAVSSLVSQKRQRGSPIKVKLSFIIDRHNYKAIPDMIAAGLKLGVDHMFFCNFLSAPFDGLRADQRALMDAGVIKEEIVAMFASYPPAVRKKLTPPVLIDANMGRNECDTHFSQIRFDGAGNVSSCSMMLLNMAGHGSYKDEGVWNNEFFRDMRRRFLSSDGSLVPEPCKVCPDNKGVHIGE
jgi:MoaA/NifB/PqqE/SkfB family radical SAM enzyme